MRQIVTIACLGLIVACGAGCHRKSAEASRLTPRERVERDQARVKYLASGEATLVKTAAGGRYASFLRAEFPTGERDELLRQLVSDRGLTERARVELLRALPWGCGEFPSLFAYPAIRWRIVDYRRSEDFYEFGCKVEPTAEERRTLDERFKIASLTQAQWNASATAAQRAKWERQARAVAAELAKRYPPPPPSGDDHENRAVRVFYYWGREMPGMLTVRAEMKLYEHQESDRFNEETAKIIRDGFDEPLAFVGAHSTTPVLSSTAQWHEEAYRRYLDGEQPQIVTRAAGGKYRTLLDPTLPAVQRESLIAELEHDDALTEEARTSVLRALPWGCPPWGRTVPQGTWVPAPERGEVRIGCFAEEPTTGIAHIETTSCPIYAIERACPTGWTEGHASDVTKLERAGWRNARNHTGWRLCLPPKLSADPACCETGRTIGPSDYEDGRYGDAGRWSVRCS
jgi:hypothetical protein